jgi:chemotaxis protein MotB
LIFSLSNNILLNIGGYEITPCANQMLGKVANVINPQPDIQFIVDGYTERKSI